MFRPPVVDLYNTPGIYYAAAYWISSMVFISCLPREEKKGGVRAMQILILLVLAVFMTLTHNRPRILFIPCVLFDFSLVCANIYLSCNLTPVLAVYYSLHAFMCGELAAALDWQLFYYGLTKLGMPLNMRTNLLFLIPTWLLVFGLVYIAAKLIYKKNGIPEIDGRILGPMIVIVVFFYFWSNISYIFRGTAFTASSAQELFIIRTLSDLGCVGVLVMYHMMLCQMSARMESEKMNRILEMQYAAFKGSQESIALVNRKYHDLKHQISVLRGSTNEDERREYLDQMDREIRSFEAQTNCGNEVLDAILGAKILQCQNENIDFHVMADGSALRFMNKMDISALFGNILDNAIEAVLQVPDESKRKIRLQVNSKNGFVKILAQNTFAGEVLFSEGEPKTTKTYEKGYHGYGVKSIRATADKYGGNAMMKIDGDWFQVHVLLPIPKV